MWVLEKGLKDSVNVNVRTLMLMLIKEKLKKYYEISLFLF